MPLDPSIPLQVKPIQLPDIGQQYLQAQNLAMHRQLQQQQLESGALEIAAKKKEVGAQDTLGKLLSTHTTITPEGELKTDHGAVIKGLADSGYGAKALAYDAQRRADLKSALDAQELKTKIAGEKAGRLGSLASSVPKVDWNAPDAAQQAQAAQVAMKRSLDTALAEGLLDPEHVKGLEGQPYSPELEAQIQQFGTQAMKSAEQHTAHIADLGEIRNQAELKIKQAAESRAAEKAPYEIGNLKEQESARKTKEYAETLTSAAKESPGALAAAMSRLYLKDPAGFQKFNGLTAQSKPEDILAVATTPQERIQAGLTTARNAQIAKNEDRMRSIAEGQLNISREHADIAKKIYEQTYGEGANPALVGVEPKLRTQAATAAQKAADQYTTAMESSAHVQSFIDLARKGNKAAGSNLPLMGAESIQALNGIKRINRSEIEQYQGAGSLLDRIQGKIGKITAGQPIPADVMKDIEELHKAISGNAASAYNAKLEGINQNYRSNFKPVKGAEENAAKSKLSTGHAVGDVVNINGKQYKITKLLPDDKFEADEVK